MYSKQEAAQLKQEFWTTFGRYMTPVLSAEGEKISWINYKTGEKYIYFKMQADSKTASIAIEFAHPDNEIQQLYFEQLQQMKLMFSGAVMEEWKWQLLSKDELGRTFSNVYKELKQVNIFNKEDWPKLISFFKPRIIALDAFWSSAKYGFEALR
jgi:hypothetical protein